MLHQIVRRIWTCRPVCASAPKRNRLGIDLLADRIVPAGNISVVAGDSAFQQTLVIDGTDETDVVRVSMSPVIVGSVHFGDRVNVTMMHSNHTDTFTHVNQFFGITKIEFRGNGGDDVFRNDTDFKCVAFGGSGNDRLIGGTNNDSLDGGLGRDSVQGMAGDDALKGGPDANQLDGGPGNDFVEGWTDSDIVNGGPGNDSLYGFQGDDALNGDGDDDQLFGGSENDWLTGGSGQDELRGEDGSDNLYGDDGNDKLYGGIGDDWLFGIAGNDSLFGEQGSDYLAGGANDDRLYGNEGADILRGDDGNDYLSGGDDGVRDELRGGKGADYFEADEILAPHVVFSPISGQPIGVGFHTTDRDVPFDLNTAEGDRYNLVSIFGL